VIRTGTEIDPPETSPLGLISDAIDSINLAIVHMEDAYADLDDAGEEWAAKQVLKVDAILKEIVERKTPGAGEPDPDEGRDDAFLPA
jgi:hypothetical protein